MSDYAPIVNYWGISILSSRTFWLNTVALFIIVLSATEVVAVVPLRYMPIYSALLAVLNIVARTATVRPVVFSAPGSVTPVAVARLGPPPPPIVSD